MFLNLTLNVWATDGWDTAYVEVKVIPYVVNQGIPMVNYKILRIRIGIFVESPLSMNT